MSETSMLDTSTVDGRADGPGAGDHGGTGGGGGRGGGGDGRGSAGGSGGTGRRKIAPFIALVVAIVIAGLFVVLAGSDTGRQDSVSTFLLGKPAPSIVSTTTSGQPFDLSRRKGSWVVLNFFASNCVPCLDEHPELIAFDQQQQALGIDGAELYSVLNDDTAAKADAFFAEHGGTWPVIVDDPGTVSVDFGVAQVPETWIVDPDGIIQARYPGEITADGLSTQLQALREAYAAGPVADTAP